MTKTMRRGQQLRQSGTEQIITSKAAGVSTGVSTGAEEDSSDEENGDPSRLFSRPPSSSSF